MDEKLQDVVIALQHGDRITARNLLRDILQNSPSADAWFLASKVAPSEDQKIKFLQNALSLDPFHESAAKTLSDLRKVEVSHTKQKVYSEMEVLSKKRSIWPPIYLWTFGMMAFLSVCYGIFMFAMGNQDSILIGTICMGSASFFAFVGYTAAKYKEKQFRERGW
ncbi:MAG: hypothetical protein DPW16_02940 [Chloroflexi bacterium]|nr:hypothetical protein [Chloroflexota bacterium]